MLKAAEVLASLPPPGEPWPGELVKAARKTLGHRSQADLAAVLELAGESGSRTVRAWEASDGARGGITGPARVAMRLMLEAASTA